MSRPSLGVCQGEARCSHLDQHSLNVVADHLAQQLVLWLVPEVGQRHQAQAGAHLHIMMQYGMMTLTRHIMPDHAHPAAEGPPHSWQPDVHTMPLMHGQYGVLAHVQHVVHDLQGQMWSW